MGIVREKRNERDGEDIEFDADISHWILIVIQGCGLVTVMVLHGLGSWLDRHDITQIVAGMHLVRMRRQPTTFSDEKGKSLLAST